MANHKCTIVRAHTSHFRPRWSNTSEVVPEQAHQAHFGVLAVRTVSLFVAQDRDECCLLCVLLLYLWCGLKNARCRCCVSVTQSPRDRRYGVAVVAADVVGITLSAGFGRSLHGLKHICSIRMQRSVTPRLTPTTGQSSRKESRLVTSQHPLCSKAGNASVCNWRVQELRDPLRKIADRLIFDSDVSLGMSEASAIAWRDTVVLARRSSSTDERRWHARWYTTSSKQSVRRHTYNALNDEKTWQLWAPGGTSTCV